MNFAPAKTQNTIATMIAFRWALSSVLLTIVVSSSRLIVNTLAFNPSITLPAISRGTSQRIIKSYARKRRRTEADDSIIIDDTDDDDDYDKLEGNSDNKNDSTNKSTMSINATNNDEDTLIPTKPPRRTTLSGGPTLIFEMARRMLVWDDELYDNSGTMLNDASSSISSPSKQRVTTSSYTSQRFTSFPPTSTSAVPSSYTNPLSTPVPKWRPTNIRRQSVSDINPAFRTSSPIMTSAGYLGILRRNSRKKNKPSMWKHCLRVYNKMAELESIADGGGEGGSIASITNASGGASLYTSMEEGVVKHGSIPGVGSFLGSLSLPAPPSPPSAQVVSSSAISGSNVVVSDGTNRKKKRIRRTTSHHEAALVAASKLGMWEEALRIYRSVEQQQGGGITDNMILSVIGACVRRSSIKYATINDENNSYVVGVGDDNRSPGRRSGSMRTLTVEERRRPLDAARRILLSLEERHDIPLVARHVNPLASAYNRLRLHNEASSLINDNLQDRIPPPPILPSLPSKSGRWKEKLREHEEDRAIDTNPDFEAVQLAEWTDDDLDEVKDDEDDIDAEVEIKAPNVDDDGYDGDDMETQLNIHELKAKDRASYSLLVQGAVMEGDWTSAIEELRRMTNVGLHPNSRNLNSWNEVLERGCRPSGNVRRK